MVQERPLRADAARNRAKILEAANAQIVAHGPEAPMETIAEVAGVAVGTLYRHFPTKNDLVSAVIEAQLERMAVETETAAARVDSGERACAVLTEFAEHVIEVAVQDRAVKAAARSLGAEYDAAGRLERMTAAFERIIRAAKDEGDLRADATVEDFHLLFWTVPAEQPVPVRRRWLTLMLDGLRPVGPS